MRDHVELLLGVTRPAGMRCTQGSERRVLMKPPDRDMKRGEHGGAATKPAECNEAQARHDSSVALRL